MAIYKFIMNQTFKLLVNGKLLANSTETFDVINPANETIANSCPQTTKSIAELTVNSAYTAFQMEKNQIYLQKSPFEKSL